MASYTLHYREEMPTSVVKELDDLVAHFNNVLSTSLNKDGSLILATPSGTGASSNTTSISEQIETVEGHWWKKGPWRFDTDSTHEAFIFTPPIPAGTYNDFAPQGVATCIGIEINLAGNITLTGLKAPDRAYRRLVVLRNQSSSFTVTLKHQNTGSAQLNRFALPGNVDITISQNQTVWLYYDADNHYWASFITPNTSGGLAGAGSGFVVGPASAVDSNVAVFDGTTGKLIKDGGQTIAQIIAASGGGSVWTSVTANVTNGQLKTLQSVPVTIIGAPGANLGIIIGSVSVAVTQSVAGNSGTWRIQAASVLGIDYVTNIPNDLNNGRNKVFQRPGIDFGAVGANVTNMRNKALVFIADADPASSGDATAIVTIVYRTIAWPA